MNIDDFKAKLEEVLTTQLDVENPEHLYSQATVIESLSYLVVKYQAEAEQKGARAERILRERGSNIKNIQGTAVDKKLQWEASTAVFNEKVEKYKAEAKYWYGVGKAIERKVILAQSILSNVTASIKAGVR